MPLLCVRSRNTYSKFYYSQKDGQTGATIEIPFSAFVAWQFLRNERYHLETKEKTKYKSAGGIDAKPLEYDCRQLGLVEGPHNHNATHTHTHLWFVASINSFFKFI